MSDEEFWMLAYLAAILSPKLTAEIYSEVADEAVEQRQRRWENHHEREQPQSA